MIKLKGVVMEDFLQYKVPCMVLEFPNCSFKCDKEAGVPVCQNSELASAPTREFDVHDICKAYLSNDITSAICFQGLEPFDSIGDVMSLVWAMRQYYNCHDDIVIYTGYNEYEISSELLLLSKYDNIIVKFGRFIPNRPHIYDEVLGVELSSDNQYARRL